jgi:ribosomal protein S18 acetylase RimI-like enzyme
VGVAAGLDGGLTLVVRAASADDAAFVASLAARFAETAPAWRTSHEVTCGTLAEFERAFASAELRAGIFIAWDGRERVGFVYVVRQLDFFTGETHGHVSEIAVVRDGSGAGRALMRAAEDYCRGLGVRFVTLNVNESNARAMRFYERLGFVPQIRQFVKVLRPGPA